MPLGNVLGEFNSKITSSKQTELSGGQIRVEIDMVGNPLGRTQGKILCRLYPKSHWASPIPLT